ncbi:MAG: methyltransferase domain-containing protein [Candidatus Pacebacteria bacterium]|nr:methyltransferase domain-containing protein [Candidatus Paceibacterota bacterium]
MISLTRTLLVKKRGYRKDIKGDCLSLYLSNTPIFARYLAERIGDDKKVLVELCCGIGVTLEVLATKFRKVIGIDRDKKVLRMCKENLQTVGALGNATLIVGDIQDEYLFHKLKGDVVIYDIPYWYPGKYPQYTNGEGVDVKNPDLVAVISNVRNYISKDIVIFTPREMDYEYFRKKLGRCECMNVIINGKHDRNCVFLGSLMKEEGTTLINLVTEAIL